MVFHFKYSEEGLEERSKIFGRLIILCIFLLIISTIFASAQTSSEEDIGWDYKQTNLDINLFDTIILNESIGYVVGENGVIIHTNNSGESWKIETVSTSFNLNAIDYSNDIIFVAGANGTIYAKNHTNPWIDVSLNSSVNLNDISIASSPTFNETVVYAVGDFGNIWKTIDGGENWEEQNAQTVVNLNGVDFFNSSFGVVVGDNSTILGTEDSGVIWDSREIPTEFGDVSLQDIVIYSQIRAYIVGNNGTLLKSDLSVSEVVTYSWSIQDTGTLNNLYALDVQSVSKIWMVGSNSTILYTNNGGSTFNEQILDNEAANNDIYGISIINSQYGFVSGENGLVLYTDREGIAERSRPQVTDYNDWGIYLEDALPTLFEGFQNMLKIIFFSMFIGFVLGVLFALFKTVENPLLNLIATVYTDFFRNTPLLVQLFIIHFGLPDLGVDLSFGGRIARDFASSIIGLGLNSGAYQAEIIRSGIQAIPTGQMEAGRSVGLTYLQTMRYIILPQAIRIVIPPLGNEFVNLTLNSSLTSTIGYLDLTRAGTLIIAYSFLFFRTWVLVALFYFVITYALTNLLRYYEKKSRIPGLGQGRI